MLQATFVYTLSMIGKKRKKMFIRCGSLLQLAKTKQVCDENTAVTKICFHRVDDEYTAYGLLAMIARSEKPQTK